MIFGLSCHRLHCPGIAISAALHGNDVEFIFMDVWHALTQFLVLQKEATEEDTGCTEHEKEEQKGDDDDRGI